MRLRTAKKAEIIKKVQVLYLYDKELMLCIWLLVEPETPNVREPLLFTCTTAPAAPAPS